MAGRMAGKNVIVTGAGQQPGLTYGNGRAIALTMAREGASVLVVDLELDRAEETVAEIRQDGGTAHPYRADVTSSAQCSDIVDTAIETMGTIDVLVNNVGTNIGDTDALSLSEDVWHRMLDINLKSTWLMSRCVIPHLRASGSGAITNISSMAGLTGVTNYFSYGVAKAGVIALGHALARENASFNVRVNTIAPGLIETPLGNESYVARGGGTREEISARRAQAVPMGRQGSAWDVANTALFLSSDESAFITGAVVRVDGGSGTIIGHSLASTKPSA